MLIKEPWKLDVVVNKENWLAKSYEHYDLIVPKVKFLDETLNSARLMRHEAARALEKLFWHSKRAKIELYAVSGYRSFERQREIFKKNYKRDGEIANKYSARPGQSEHQTGLAMDVTCAEVDFELTGDFEHTKAYEWLTENMHDYGFVLRYPKGKEDITGYIFEPWHLRYVGKALAKELYKNNLTLEEYVRVNKKGGLKSTLC